jgi:formyl-CoA transferase
VPLINSPMRLSATPTENRLPPPLLGQHTDDVLRELLDVGDDELGKLRAGGVI